MTRIETYSKFVRFLILEGISFKVNVSEDIIELYDKNFSKLTTKIKIRLDEKGNEVFKIVDDTSDDTKIYSYDEILKVISIVKEGVK